MTATWLWMRQHCTRSENGASLVEYALLLALIAVVCVGAVAFFGTELTENLSRSGSKLQ
jgi:pilus assembly protein Flp/PilA